jgi:hypothetical protein
MYKTQKKWQLIVDYNETVGYKANPQNQLFTTN